jgi:hypothetical protein
VPDFKISLLCLTRALIRIYSFFYSYKRPGLTDDFYGKVMRIKGIRQYIFLLFHLEELLKLYVNLFYRFCVTVLFLEIFEQKKSQISELSAILDFGGYACDIISRVTQEFYP